MHKMTLPLHISSVLVAYSVFGVSHLLLPRTASISDQGIVVASAIAVFAGMGFVTGLLLMFRKRGRTENIILAISTIAAFLLLVLTA